MFLVFISIICLIITLLVLTILYNIINKFIYSTTRYKISNNIIIQYILTGLFISLACILEYDLVTSTIKFLF